jgi:CheY-like chemotaxis protein
MKEKSVLVIDDSSTIRRLCDNELSNAGFRVLLAPTAEAGVAAALEQTPDLIILDHQLPGTTGYDVCCQLLAIPETEKIPIVASSTLRKKAYAEYVDCDNVVDMLPKPYTPEALIATVENAINTAEMVVQSQCDGSAVPEVIDEMGESALSGAFGCFGLREILDLLNNGAKTGVLEVETARYRVYVYVDKGRIQAVTASGVEPETVAQHMPDALAELAPVIKFTVAGRRGSEVDGLVELLNNKVLDPRLLKKLLRLQAAVLLRFCFTDQLKSFRFDQNRSAPPLFQKLPLEGSLLSFLVEGALICDEQELPSWEEGTGYVRKSIRGQNLDRAGLSSRHMGLMSLMSEPISVSQMAQQLGWPVEEVQRVAHGFELAELVERCQITNTVKVFSVISESQLGRKLGSFFQANRQELTGKVVRDWLGLKLLLRRSRPDVLMVELQEDMTQLQKLFDEPANLLENVRIIGFSGADSDDDQRELPETIHSTMSVDFDDQQLRKAIISLPNESGNDGGFQPAFNEVEFDQSSSSPVSTTIEG